MTPRTPTRGGAIAPLAYWLALLSGLGAFTAFSKMPADALLSIWLGTVIGATFGQVTAFWRLRLWLVVLLGFCGAMVLAPLCGSLWRSHVDLAVRAFAAATICGYASLTERGFLLSFWLPAMLFVLAAVDPASATLLVSESLWLFVALGVTFILALYAHERRRIGLWHARGAARLPGAPRRTVLRAEPLRASRRIVVLGALTTCAVLLTAWLAPFLWQRDPIGKIRERTSNATARLVPSTVSSGLASGRVAARRAWDRREARRLGVALEAEKPCCPSDSDGRRVKEFLPFTTGSGYIASRSTEDCAICRDGIPIEVRAKAVPATTNEPIALGPRSGAWYGTGGASADGTPTTVASPHSQWSPPTSSYRSPRSSDYQSSRTVDTSTDASTTTDTTRPSVSNADPPRSNQSSGPTSYSPTARTDSGSSPSVSWNRSTSRSTTTAWAQPPAPETTKPEESSGRPWAIWLLAGGTATLIFQLGSRVLRRRATIRHLRRPLWQENVAQRVSNSWQLVLIGLCDAGFQVRPGEQPQEVARRVGIAGLSTCASVLERARHGVRVDAEDLRAMSAAAESVYSAARARLGWGARLFAHFRARLV